MAILLRTDARPIAVTPANGTAYTLAELQAIVGGYIEVVPTALQVDGTRLLMVLNEDGKRLMLPPNGFATSLLYQAGGHPDDTVVGDVLLATLQELDEPDDEEVT